MSCRYQTRQSGHGFPLLLLHGLMGHPDNWTGVFKTLPEGVRAIALDLPFFSDGADLKEIPAICQYVRDFCDEQNFEQVVLGGNSLGGHVSLRLAMEMPDRVAGLVLTGSSGLFERDLGTHRGANPDRQWYRNKMQEVFYDPAHVTEGLVDMVVDVLTSRQARRVLVSIAKSAKRDNLASCLPQITCPALLVWGRDDQITPPEVAREFHDLLPNSELAWLDRCGHAAMLEHPEALGREIATWWARHFPEHSSNRPPQTGQARSIA